MRGRPDASTTVRARELRRHQTDVEQRLWRALRARGFAGAKFRRQLLIGHYIVDFACPLRRLVVELDGGQHAAQASSDAARSRTLAAHGYRVIRFWNNDVNDNLPGVLAAIESALADPSPFPLPAGGERVTKDRSTPSPPKGERAGVRGLKKSRRVSAPPVL
ncbi:MAG: endonuclease domain-containing protein [Alphaproteobacteria bacterium]|nr:endonuclease domain-containing protein [Alphaproteobacteria bacterium]